MRGLLFDVNLDGYRQRLLGILRKHGFEPLMNEWSLSFATFSELGIDPETLDRSVWNYCQAQGWVLLTDNRNHDGEDSLQATLDDSWVVGCYPIVTIGDKYAFENDPLYAAQVAFELADLLIDVKEQFNLHQPRFYIPR